MQENQIAPLSAAPDFPPTSKKGKNAAIVYLASLGSAHSRRAMQHDLEVIAEIAAPGVPFDALPWGALRYEHTQAIRARLAERYDVASTNHMLSAMRQVLKNAWRLGQMSAEEYMRAADIQNVKGSKPEQATGRAVTDGELRAIVAVCKDGTVSGARDAAIFALAYSGGLRRAELTALDFEHIDAETGVLKVHGKGNKQRTVHIHNGALKALQDWLSVRGSEPGALFLPTRKGGTLLSGRLNTQAIYDIMRHRAKQAGVKEFSPHDLRRTFAGEMLDAGVDIATVQKMMGHANVSTTAGYDRRGERAKADAAKKLHYPY